MSSPLCHVGDSVVWMMMSLAVIGRTDPSYDAELDSTNVAPPAAVLNDEPTATHLSAVMQETAARESLVPAIDGVGTICQDIPFH